MKEADNWRNLKQLYVYGKFLFSTAVCLIDFLLSPLKKKVIVQKDLFGLIKVKHQDKNSHETLTNLLLQVSFFEQKYC